MIVFVNGFNGALYNGWANGIINGADGHFKLRHEHYEDHASTDMERMYIEDPKAFSAIAAFTISLVAFTSLTFFH